LDDGGQYSRKATRMARASHVVWNDAFSRSWSILRSLLDDVCKLLDHNAVTEEDVTFSRRIGMPGLLL
jgi:hypothetical protein